MLYMLLDFVETSREIRSCLLEPKAGVLGSRSFGAHGLPNVRTAMASRSRRTSCSGIDQYLDKLGKLQELYAMKMPTVADRLNERLCEANDHRSDARTDSPPMRQLRAT